MIYIRWNVIGHRRAECFLHRAWCLEPIRIVCDNISYYLILERLRIIGTRDARVLRKCIKSPSARNLWQLCAIVPLYFSPGTSYDRLITHIQPHLWNGEKFWTNNRLNFLTTKFQACSPPRGRAHTLRIGITYFTEQCSIKIINSASDTQMHWPAVLLSSLHHDDVSLKADVRWMSSF